MMMMMMMMLRREPVPVVQHGAQSDRSTNFQQQDPAVVMTSSRSDVLQYTDTAYQLINQSINQSILLFNVAQATNNYIGVASYGTVGHVSPPRRTPNCLIFLVT